MRAGFRRFRGHIPRVVLAAWLAGSSVLLQQAAFGAPYRYYRPDPVAQLNAEQERVAARMQQLEMDIRTARLAADQQRELQALALKQQGDRIVDVHAEVARFGNFSSAALAIAGTLIALCIGMLLYRQLREPKTLANALAAQRRALENEQAQRFAALQRELEQRLEDRFKAYAAAPRSASRVADMPVAAAVRVESEAQAHAHAARKPASPPHELAVSSWPLAELDSQSTPAAGGAGAVDLPVVAEVAREPALIVPPLLSDAVALPDALALPDAVAVPDPAAIPVEQQIDERAAPVLNEIAAATAVAAGHDAAGVVSQGIESQGEAVGAAAETYAVDASTAAPQALVLDAPSGLHEVELVVETDSQAMGILFSSSAQPVESESFGLAETLAQPAEMSRASFQTSSAARASSAAGAAALDDADAALADDAVPGSLPGTNLPARNANVRPDAAPTLPEWLAGALHNTSMSEVDAVESFELFDHAGADAASRLLPREANTLGDPMVGDLGSRQLTRELQQTIDPDPPRPEPKAPLFSTANDQLLQQLLNMELRDDLRRSLNQSPELLRALVQQALSVLLKPESNRTSEDWRLLVMDAWRRGNFEEALARTEAMAKVAQSEKDRVEAHLQRALVL